MICFALLLSRGSRGKKLEARGANLVGVPRHLLRGQLETIFNTAIEPDCLD